MCLILTLSVHRHSINRSPTGHVVVLVTLGNKELKGKYVKEEDRQGFGRKAREYCFVAVTKQDFSKANTIWTVLN